jgi:DNA polymerase-3 subunit alpha
LFNTQRDLLKKDNLLVVKGQVSVDEYTGGFKMAAETIYDIDQARNLFAEKILIQLNEHNIGNNTLERVADVLREASKGPCPIWIQYRRGDAQGTLRFGEDWTINISNDILRKLQAIVGERGLRVVYKKPNAIPRMDSAA